MSESLESLRLDWVDVERREGMFVVGDSIIDCYARRRCVCGRGENDIYFFRIVFLVRLGMSHRHFSSVLFVSLLGLHGYVLFVSKIECALNR